jgi:flagellar hook-associated protein 2
LNEEPERLAGPVNLHRPGQCDWTEGIVSNTSSIFTGASRYSSDFQSVIDRAVAIASLPLTQYQSVKAQLQKQSDALSTLDTKLFGLQSALAGITGAAGTGSLTATAADSSVVSAHLGTGALEGTYTIEVIDLGSYRNTMSKDGLPAVSDPSSGSISSSTSYTLTVGSAAYAIQPSGSSLNQLVAAINAKAEAGVQATIVNIGSSTQPDYRLSIQSRKLGAIDIQLNDGSQDLLDALTSGETQASYKVNGRATVLTSDTRTITLAPGLTVDLLKAGSSTTVTVSRNTSAFTEAIQSFVNAYNAVVDALDAHHGKDAGALSGQSIIRTLADSLRGMTNYSASGAITSLTDLGLEFDSQGKLSLDTSTFSGVVQNGYSSLLTFLGDTASGGFLKAATDAINSMTDPDSGSLKSAIKGIGAQITAQDASIAAQQERIDNLETSLREQINAADALIASLEQQAVYFTNMFQAMAEARKQYS